jgi:assimilatory nitrate reductase catalytic subunit
MRFASYDNGYLTGMLFLAPEPVAVSREWAISQLATPDATLRKRNAVLAGRPGAGGRDRGATVCACFGIGANDIAAAVVLGCCTVAAVGEVTQAGTNCGSCRPEIKRIIQENAVVSAG